MTELLTEKILIRITPSLKLALLAKAERLHIRLQDVCRNALAEHVVHGKHVLFNGKDYIKSEK